MPRKSKDWNLNGERFDLLLRRLDPDRERAGMRYNRLRSKFVEYVRNNSRCDPEKVADIIMDRLAGKLEEKPITSSEIERYAYEVARLVVKEENRRYGKVVIIEFWLERVRHRWAKQVKPDEECLERAIKELSEDERELLAQYYPQERPESGLAEHRNLLAQRLGISNEALRKRVGEVRKKVTCLYEVCNSKKIT